MKNKIRKRSVTVSSIVFIMLSFIYAKRAFFENERKKTAPHFCALTFEGPPATTQKPLL